MDPQQWVAARDALSAMLAKRGMPPDFARQAADRLLSVLGHPHDEAGRRELVLLDFQFIVEPNDGEYWISREQLERALALVEPDPTLSEEFPAG